jgi:hypothetical protein
MAATVHLAAVAAVAAVEEPEPAGMAAMVIAAAVAQGVTPEPEEKVAVLVAALAALEDLLAQVAAQEVVAEDIPSQ